MQIRTGYSLAAIFVLAVMLVSSDPLRASDYEDRVEASARQSYVYQTYLKDDDIKVKVDDGVVTLTGTVAETFHKWMAEDMVLGLPGVKRVNNKLTVIASPTTEPSDAWLREKVRNSLLFHRSVSYANTDVSVIDGNVTLRGVASSEAQKQLTTEYVKDIRGVKEVVNEMTVAEIPTESSRTAEEVIDDASITTQVRTSLMFHRSVNGIDTKVSTHKGVVTLSGTAINQAEIDLVSKRVGDIHGVLRVNNQMTIEVSRSSTN